MAISLVLACYPKISEVDDFVHAHAHARTLAPSLTHSLSLSLTHTHTLTLKSLCAACAVCHLSVAAQGLPADLSCLLTERQR
jgi:hypothetical protein